MLNRFVSGMIQILWSITLIKKNLIENANVDLHKEPKTFLKNIIRFCRHQFKDNFQRKFKSFSPVIITASWTVFDYPIEKRTEGE